MAWRVNGHGYSLAALSEKERRSAAAKACKNGWHSGCMAGYMVSATATAASSATSVYI